MPGYWQAKPVQYCHLFKKLEDVTSCFENKNKTLRVLSLLFWFFVMVLALGSEALLCKNRILGLQGSKWIYISNVNKLDSTLFTKMCYSTLNFGIALLNGKGASVWPLPLTAPEPALMATCGVAAGGCKIQVLVLGVYFYSCCHLGLWTFSFIVS